MFSGSVDAGFILALPFHQGDLEPDCVGVSMREGAYARGGGGAHLRDNYGYLPSLLYHPYLVCNHRESQELHV